MSSDVAAIAARWQAIGGWRVPLRDHLWVEAEDGTGVAAVSGSYEELMQGVVERRRQAIAHAPDDIRALLSTIQALHLRYRQLTRASHTRKPAGSTDAKAPQRL